MTLQLFIGQANLRGAIGKYASRFNLLELRADQERLPREPVLRRWAEEVPERFAFSVLIAPQHLKESSGPKSVLERVTSAARCLNAKWIIVQTDPMWGPSQRTRHRLRELFSPLLDESRRVGWEPHGVWQDDEALAYATELGVHYVRDVGRGDPLGQAVIYSRMPGLGVSARMSLGAMERAAANIGSASEAFLVVGGDGARKLQQLLPELVQSHLLGSSSNLNPDSIVETFGGFTAPDAADEDEMFDDFDDDESETEEGDDESGELDEADGEATDLDEELADEEDDDSSDQQRKRDPSRRGANGVKRAHDKSKASGSTKQRKESGRR